MRYLIWSVIGFIFGSCMFSYWIPKYFLNVDVTKKSDDGNPGAANVFTNAGLKTGILCLALDIGKGILPVYMACRVLDPDALGFAFVLAAPVFGHALSPFMKFKGGKAIAVSFGVLIGALPFDQALWLLVFSFLFFSLVLKINPHGARVIVTYIIFSVAVIRCIGWGSVTAGCMLISAIVMARHIHGFTFKDITVQIGAHQLENRLADKKNGDKQA